MSTDAAHDTYVQEEPTRLRTLSVTLLALLLAQVLLGLANTFWLELPESGSGWKAAQPMMLLNAHMALGLVTVVGAAWATARAIRGRHRAWTALSTTGVLGTVVALASGIGFMGHVADDTLSFLMGAGTVVAIGAYAWGLALRTPR
ncbi:MAG TPA: hypothetical protein VFK68_02470 [Propionibacteriaceae bacterium]|nr:hypothetical protein [Propionibacteriaceae bacterium]